MCTLKNSSPTYACRVWWLTLRILALRRQRQVEHRPSLVYTVSGQSGLHSETLSQQRKGNKDEDWVLKVDFFTMISKQI